MRRAEFVINADVNASGIAHAGTTSAGAIPLNGALISGGIWESPGDFGQQVAITSAGDDHAITFTVYGKDQDGKTTTETVSGTTASAATTSAYFSLVSSVTASGTTAGSVSVGLLGSAASHTYVMNYKSNPFQAALAVEVSGTINGTVQHTFDDVFDKDWTAAGATWFSHDDTDMVGYSANQNSNYSFPPVACRNIINTAATSSAATFVVIVPA